MADDVSVCLETENGVAMSTYSHLTAEERDRLAGLKADGLSLRSIAKALGRAASSISRELRRNALDSGAYRPHGRQDRGRDHRRDDGRLPPARPADTRLGQVRGHRRGVAPRHDQPGALAPLGADRAEDVCPFGALVMRGGRPRAEFRPATGDVVLLPDASFILLTQLYLSSGQKPRGGSGNLDRGDQWMIAESEERTMTRRPRGDHSPAVHVPATISG